MDLRVYFTYSCLFLFIVSLTNVHEYRQYYVGHSESSSVKKMFI